MWMNEWKLDEEPDHGRLWMLSKEMEQVLLRNESSVPSLEDIYKKSIVAIWGPCGGALLTTQIPVFVSLPKLLVD